jgi:hypothetical protein
MEQYGVAAMTRIIKPLMRDNASHVEKPELTLLC